MFERRLQISKEEEEDFNIPKEVEKMETETNESEKVRGDREMQKLSV